jgi:hypothetical protein
MHASLKLALDATYLQAETQFRPSANILINLAIAI